jgi:pyruvate/2-oxoglutarate dehydrogenase complex dihydrolipoamide acyltransferase (E2) component
MAKHLELVPQRSVSSFRKLAIGSWRTAHDPTVYGTLTVRVDAALGFLESFHARTGVRLELAHLVVRAVAEALRRCPDANAVLRFNRIYLRERVDVSLLVTTGEGAAAELVPAKLEGVDGLSLREVAEGLHAAEGRVRAGEDLALERERRVLARVPFLLLRPFSRLVSLLQHTLNLDLRRLGLPRDPFGSAAVVDVGALGVDTAYLPLVPHAHVPIVVAVGAVREVALVQPDGRVGVGRVMNVNASFDHRFIDGYHAAVLARTVQELLEQPGELPEGRSPAPIPTSVRSSR